jgi:uncharacterized membrane protein YoaK (UPF0700 family)
MGASGTEQPERELRARYWWIALALSAIAGSVDGVGYLLLSHVFTSHMSGNTVALTIDVAWGHWRAAWRHFEPIVTFFVGVLLGLLAAEVLMRRGFLRIFAVISGIEALLLIVFLLLAHPVRQWMVLWPASAMGMQNALLRRVGNRSVRTTFITGMLATTANKLASALVSALERGHDTREHFQAFLSYAAIWICFAAGGIVSAFTELRQGTSAMVIPIAGLALMIAYDLARPVTLYATRVKSEIKPS